MNAYEKIINTMRKEGNRTEPKTLRFGTMTSYNTCKMGEIELEADDLMISADLVDNYENNRIKNGDTVTLHGSGEYLKNGDEVVIKKTKTEHYLKKDDEVVLQQIEWQLYFISSSMAS